MHHELENAPESVQNFFRNLNICVEDMTIYLTDLAKARDTFVAFKDAGDVHLVSLQSTFKGIIFDILVDMQKSIKDLNGELI